MIAIRTDKTNWNGEALIGQFDNGDVALEVEAVPGYAHTDITDSNILITQRVFDGKFGKALPYSEIARIKGLLDELGDYGKAAGSVSELETRMEITNIQLAMVEGG